MLHPRQEALRVRFPEFRDQGEVLAVMNTLAALNDAYELVAVATVPGYEEAYIPTQLRPRRRSRLAPEDRLRAAQITYGSELQVVLSTALDLVPAAAGGLAVAGGTVWGALKAVPAALDAIDKISFFREERDKKRQDYALQRERDAYELEDLRLKRMRLVEEASGMLMAAQEVVARPSRRRDALPMVGEAEADVLLAAHLDRLAERIENTAGMAVFEDLNSSDLDG